MKKRIVVIISALMACVISSTAYATDADKQARISEIEQQIADLQAELETLKSEVIQSDDTAGTFQGTSLDQLDYYSDGQYKVGQDFEAGLYLLITTDDTWGGSVTTSSDANGDDINVIEVFDYNFIVEIQDGEFVNLTRCRAYNMKNDPAFDINKAEMMIVGHHIPAGEYKLISTDEEWGASYTIYTEARKEDIKAIDVFDGRAYISVSDGDYLMIKRCYIEGIQTP